MTSLQQAADIVIKESLGVKKGEKVLIITDKNMKNIGDFLYKAALNITEAKINFRLIRTLIWKIKTFTY